MAGPKGIFAALAASGVLMAQAAPPVAPGNVAPAMPDRTQMLRATQKDFAETSVVGGAKMLKDLAADPDSTCADLKSIQTMQEQILQNQRNMVSRNPAMSTILEEELGKAKAGEATADAKRAVDKRCPSPGPGK